MASEISPVEGPDFICIGMPKAATGWLFDQLRNHPDFWIPSVKEVRYLSQRTPKPPPAIRHAKRSQEPDAPPPPRHAKDDRDVGFWKATRAFADKPMDIGIYKDLFRHKGNLLSGDISPGYIALKKDVIARIANELPHTKIVFLVRDPVARAISQMSMEYRLDNFDPAAMDDPDEFLAFLERSRTTRAKMFPTRIVRRWQELAPNVAFRWFLFDEIEHQPAETRHDILTYLGADPEKSSGQIEAGHNRKANDKKLTLGDGAKATLVKYFAGELRRSAELFGAAARDWPARYGL